MRDEEKEADPEGQYIQRRKSLRKACLKHYYNNYEHCTFQQKLYKHNARIIKKKNKFIIIKLYIIVVFDMSFCYLHFLFCIKDLPILLHI